MMKITLPLMYSLLLMNNNISTIIMFLSCMMITILLIFNPKHTIIISNTFMMDKFSMILILLTLTSILLIMFSSQNMKTISKTIIPIFIILMLTFSVMSMMLFYILFELVLIPTMILVMKSGKQPERLQASIYLMVYTITASLPLLVSIILLNYNQSFIMSFMTMNKLNMPILFMLAFLTKMPMFFMHLWLPKAHVEAPLEGSMILAAILLKLGGYGLMRFIPLCISKINKINHWIISISMIGATCTSLNCIRQKDLKSLIAYSSVAHMALVLLSMFTLNYIGLMGAVMMMIAHGLSSSALFLLTNDLYSKYHTRNISSFKGLINLSPNITFWWFMFMAISISAPPSINTISEIMIMSSIILWNMKSMLLIFIISIMTTSFSMMMYLNLSHNKNEMLPSNQSSMKLFTSLFIHMIPLILILFKMDLMIL
uniref:NADH-ubiquinone oxidoreductase chain 4 n=1 Tax=Wadicosa fidelis TaxID=317852 RepID=A0A0U1XXS1_WADFI|nr:NADH dehydrogenase subunit 4 [Wadicosa fidelis]AIZ97183.1 NADH dehydrogenase subunit 4 [Wadicosa fidelis]